MATCILFLAAALGAEPLTSDRAFHDFEQRLSQLLKAESQAKNATTHAGIVRNMCALHQQFVSDPRYATSDVLKEYRGRLWSRLTKIKAKLKQQLARQPGHEANTVNATALAAADATTIAAMGSLGASLAILDQTQGGPGQWMALGGGPVAPDWGPDLVDLIERTINPAFWDVAGGPGTVIYYRPLHCLVVRATAEVHGQVGGLANELRDPAQPR